MKPHSNLQRRTALKLLASTSAAGLAGCLGKTPGGPGPTGGPLTEVQVENTSLVVALSADASVDQVNVIAPNGELFGKQRIDAGVTNVSFELGTEYESGKFHVLALDAEETIDDATIEIRPELKIVDIGLYRNRPEKDWDAMYGESSTDREKNGEAFVTVENVGTGPEAVTSLRFTGDVPNLAENYKGSGLHETERVLVNLENQVDLYSETFPFGSHISEDGMGCDPTGAQGEFTVVIETSVTEPKLTRTYAVKYSGSESMYDCKISISEV